MATTNTSCEPEIKIYELLVKVKKEQPENYEPIKRILHYIYKTVKKDFFVAESNNYIKIGEKDKSQNVRAAESNLYNNYVEDEDGLLDNLIKMLQQNPQYFNYLYEKIEPFLEMSENGIYSDYGIYKYVFNLYTMFEFYKLHPEDFEGFKTIVDDLSNFFITSTLNVERHISYVWGADKPSFNTKQDIINALLSIPNYKDKPKIRQEVKKVLDEINFVYEPSLIREYETAINRLLELYETIETLKKKGHIVPIEIIDELENEIMKNIINGNLSEQSYGEKRRQAKTEPIIYLPLLLSKDRYEYFKTKSLEVEDKKEIHEDILKYLRQIDVSFFDYLDKHTHPKDSFITCMDIVFDSDTYYEVASKLTDLIEAGNIYQEDEIKALELIKNLKSVKHKEVIDGVVMAWPENNNINKTNKPVKIIDRMMMLQQTLEFAPSKDFYTNRSGSYYSKLTLKDFSERVKSEMISKRNYKLQEIERQRREAEEAAKKQQEEQAKKPKGLGSIFGKKNNN